MLESLEEVALRDRCGSADCPQTFNRAISNPLICSCYPTLGAVTGLAWSLPLPFSGRVKGALTDL